MSVMVTGLFIKWDMLFFIVDVKHVLPCTLVKRTRLLETVRQKFCK